MRIITFEGQLFAVEGEIMKKSSLVVFLICLVVLLPVACKDVNRRYLVATGTLVFTSVPPATATANAPYTYDADATGIPSATITYSLAQSPAGMTIDATTGLVSWTAGATQVGTHPVEILASASTGHTARQSYTLTVSTPPVGAIGFTSIPPGTATANVPYTYDADATGIPAATITYSLVQSPGGMTIDAATGVVSWTAGATQVGTHPVEVLASASTGHTARQSYTLTVSSPPDGALL